MIIQLKFANETDTIAAMKILQNLQDPNVSYRKEGLEKIIISGDNEAALDHAAECVSKDHCCEKIKVHIPAPSVKPVDELRCPYCGGTTISSDSAGHCCMDCYGEF